jgi:hypothetical protein
MTGTCRRGICNYYYLTAIGLTPGGSSTVHIYTQTPGGSSTVHIYTQTPGGSSTVHIYTKQYTEYRGRSTHNKHNINIIKHVLL